MMMEAVTAHFFPMCFGGEKREQPFVLCKTCSVLSGHACILPVDRGNTSFANQLQSLNER